MTTTKREEWNQILQELRADYLKVLPERLRLIRRLTEEGNFHELNREYHKLKGTGRTYGYPDISTLCERFEQLSFQPTPENQALLPFGPELLAYLIDSYQNNREPQLEAHPLSARLWGKGRSL